MSLKEYISNIILANNKINGLKRDITNLKRENAEIKSNNQNLNNKIAQIQLDNADIIKINSEYVERTKSLNNEILRLNSLIQNLNKNSQSFKNQIDILKDQMIAENMNIVLDNSFELLHSEFQDNVTTQETVESTHCKHCPKDREGRTYLCPYCLPEKKVYICGKHYQGHIKRFHKSDTPVAFRPDDYGGAITYPSTRR